MAGAIQAHWERIKKDSAERRAVANKRAAAEFRDAENRIAQIRDPTQRLEAERKMREEREEREAAIVARREEMNEIKRWVGDSATQEERGPLTTPQLLLRFRLLRRGMKEHLFRYVLPPGVGIDDPAAAAYSHELYTAAVFVLNNIFTSCQEIFDTALWAVKRSQPHDKDPEEAEDVVNVWLWAQMTNSTWTEANNQYTVSDAMTDESFAAIANLARTQFTMSIPAELRKKAMNDYYVRRIALWFSHAIGFYWVLITRNPSCVVKTPSLGDEFNEGTMVRVQGSDPRR